MRFIFSDGTIVKQEGTHFTDIKKHWKWNGKGDKQEGSKDIIVLKDVRGKGFES